jgi:hypothetical protein
MVHATHQAVTERVPAFERWGIELRLRAETRISICGNSKFFAILDVLLSSNSLLSQIFLDLLEFITKKITDNNLKF